MGVSEARANYESSKRREETIFRSASTAASYSRCCSSTMRRLSSSYCL